MSYQQFVQRNLVKITIGLVIIAVVTVGAYYIQQQNDEQYLESTEQKSKLETIREEEEDDTKEEDEKEDVHIFPLSVSDDEVKENDEMMEYNKTNTITTDDVDELEKVLRSNELLIHIITWNVNAQKPDKSFDSLLQNDNDNTCNADIYAIGLQEIVDLNAFNMITDNNANNLIILWENKIANILNHTSSKDSKYTHLESINLMGILLLIYVKNDIKYNIKHIMSNKCKSGIFGVGGNKGGVGIRFDINNISICFICCHLTADKPKLKERNENYKKIMEQLTFSQNVDNSVSDDLKNEKDEKIKILDHDIVFIFGDLNYRLQFEMSELQNIYNLIKQKKWKELLLKDQLLNTIKNGDAFNYFNEESIQFQPTYKFKIGTNEYDKHKKRIPSYCDRILWKIGNMRNDENGKKIYCRKYDAHLEKNTSDHRPVVGVYTI